MKRINLSILIALISFISVSAHDLKYDTFSYNDVDSTCTLVETKGTEPDRGKPGQPIYRYYESCYVNGYRFVAVGKGSSYNDYLGGTTVISLPSSIQYINDYSLSEVEVVSIPKDNELKYIGKYALPDVPFKNCHIYRNKDCNFHESAFVLSPWSSSIDGHLFGNSIQIDPQNPYWGLEDGMLFHKGSENIVRYFVHKEFKDTLEIPKRFTHINQITTCSRSSSEENICFEDVTTLKKLSVTYCNITNDDKVWDMSNMDTVSFSLSGSELKVKKLVFPNAKYISSLNLGSKKLNHLVLMNVEAIKDSKGYLYYGEADTISVYPKQNLGNKLFAGSYIKVLNWLNEDIPFAESMEEYANRIDVLNLGNAKAVGIRGVMYSLKNRKTESLILLSTPTPPEVLSVVLYDDYPAKVKLYVPAGSGETYRNHEKWGVIPNIIEYDVNGPDPTSGIGNIVSDNQSSVDVYTLQGVLVRKGVKRDEATQGLPQGVYIVGGEKVIVK